MRTEPTPMQPLKPPLPSELPLTEDPRTAAQPLTIEDLEDVTIRVVSLDELGAPPPEARVEPAIELTAPQTEVPHGVVPQANVSPTRSAASAPAAPATRTAI